MTTAFDGGGYIMTGEGYRLYAKTDGDSQGLAVMLSCSLAADLTMWSEQVGALCEAGFHVVRYDARGHGRSDAPPGPYDIKDLARDALQVANAVGIDRFLFCGLSLGGLVGMQLAIEQPGRLRALCLANTSPAFTPPTLWLERIDLVRRSGMAAVVEPTLTRWLTQRFRTLHPDRSDEVRRMIAATSVAGYTGSCAALSAADLWSRIAEIALPTLIIGGIHDPSVPVDVSTRLARTIPAATLMLLDAAHLSNVEAAPDFTLALVKQAEMAALS